MTQRGVMASINMIRLLNFASCGKMPLERKHPVQLVPVPLFHVNGTHNMLLSGPCLGKKLILIEVERRGGAGTDAEGENQPNIQCSYYGL